MINFGGKTKNGSIFVDNSAFGAQNTGSINKEVDDWYMLSQTIWEIGPKCCLSQFYRRF